MPLAFASESHGTIAFGFFNIEIDMLLLEQLFFFADSFCAAVVELAGPADPAHRRAVIDGWRIDDRASVGNLHGAIQGHDLSGFIGATYRRYPFPSRPEGFRQKPDGVLRQAAAREMIAPFGAPESIELSIDRRREVSLGELRFGAGAFDELVSYVDVGGYPRWEDDRRPDYVRRMMEIWPRSA